MWMWLCVRQLHDSKFHGLSKQITVGSVQKGLTTNREKFNALIKGLLWQNMGKELIMPLI